MKKTILFALSLGLLSPVLHAEPKKPAAEAAEMKKAEKPAKETKKAAPKADKEKKAADKPGELSESDKALQASAKKQADTLTPTQTTKLLELVNKGDAKALQEINGVGEKRAKNIIAKRPFTNVEDIVMVDDIGEGTFKDIIVFAKGEQPKEVKKEEMKKAEPKADKKAEKPAKEEKKAEKKEEPKAAEKKSEAPAEKPAKKTKKADAEDAPATETKKK